MIQECDLDKHQMSNLKTRYADARIGIFAPRPQQFPFLFPHNQHVCVPRPRCKAKPALTPDS